MSRYLSPWHVLSRSQRVALRTTPSPLHTAHECPPRAGPPGSPSSPSARDAGVHGARLEKVHGQEAAECASLARIQHASPRAHHRLKPAPPTPPLPSLPTVKLNGNRHITGTLRGFDQFMNLVIDEAVEQALPRPHLARALPASTSCKHAHARARSGTFARCVRSAWCGEWQERDASRPAGGGGGWGGAVLGE